MLLHIASQSRMKEVFTLSGQEATVSRHRNLMKTCAGKVILQKQPNNKYLTGYIMDEDCDRWKILLETKEYVWMDRLVYSENTVVYSNYCDANEYKIVEYSPIRLLINRGGKCKLTINRLYYNMNTLRIY